jgi:hypothetical protein
MSVEAFIWNYRDSKPIGFDFETVRELLSTDTTEWIADHGCLRVQFGRPADAVDIFLGKQAPATNHIEGIMVSRPIAHPEFLQRVFRVMKLGGVMLFYSDDTTPVFIRGADAGHYPIDLLEALGKPRYIESPAELLHQKLNPDR